MEATAAEGDRCGEKGGGSPTGNVHFEDRDF